MNTKPPAFFSTSPLLDAFLQRFGIQHKVEQAQIGAAWEKAVAVHLHPFIARKIKFVSCKQDELLVVTTTPTYAQEVQQHASKLMHGVNEAMGKVVVRKVRTRIGEV